MSLTRREFVLRSAVVAGTAAQLQNLVQAQPKPATGPTATTATLRAEGSAALKWLDGHPPRSLTSGVTWGVPWPRGMRAAPDAFALTGEGGEAIPVQTWPLATWPDGSLKWTAHAIGPAKKVAAQFVLAADTPMAPATRVSVMDEADAVTIDTGVIRCRIGKRGASLIESIERDGRAIARDATLVCLRQDQPDASTGAINRASFTGNIEKVAVEQSGPVRAVVRIEGKHVGPNDRAWLPFTVRLYFYAGADTVRLVHTFIFDGDENKDFLAGLGVRFAVPMRDQPHDRHVRFVGEGNGLWAEAVRGLTGLRRDPGGNVRTAQVAGEATPVESMPDNVKRRLDLIPAWGDYTLSQLSSDGFDIRKRTKAGHGWVKSSAGTRAAGVGYVGGTTGGVAFGLRDFWQRYPAQLDVRGANTDRADVTVWLYSPEAPAMDLRFYHDGLGQDSHAKQLDGLEITYEDYEPGFGTAHGIARTSELTLWAAAKTPSRRATIDFADAVRTPPLLACEPAHYANAAVFGALFAPADRSSPARARVEDQLDFYVDYYQKQIAQHRWYGFWDHGDVMHTYDPDRHVWRYDVGGYAWDNSELSPDLWLWYSFLRTGRADVFRMAEAMTRHTGEVDVYHLGRFKGLGTRHNVQHWGCSAKQLRISTAIYRRFYYYLTGDERVGDLMRELVDADQTFMALDPLRKIRKEQYQPDPQALGVGLGTDWSALASAWLAEWERTGDATYRDKLAAGMKSIGALPHGFFTGGARMDAATGAFHVPGKPSVEVSHLSAVFGLVEVCAELIQLLDVPEFERAWLQYCELYSAPREEQAKALGEGLRGNGLTSAHSRLTAYAAWKKKDVKLAARAWQEFQGQDQHGGINYQGAERDKPRTRRVEGPDTLNPVDEAPRVSTNDTAQWSLAAIQNLALVGDHLT
jgi:hypothetical protein